MSRPNALIQLLNDLKAESVSTTVVTIRKSSAVISIGADDDIVLTPEECELLFDTPETVQQLFEALDEPQDASIELVNISVEDEVLEAMNELFSSVDQS